MRKYLLLFVLFACSNKEKIETPPSPTVEEDISKWTPYEGLIETEFGEARIELFLDDAEPGLTSPFLINGHLTNNQVLHMFRGAYSTLNGAANNEVILQLHGQIMIGPHPKPDPKKSVTSFNPEFRDLDLFFITEGGNKLVLVDEDFDRISDDDKYTLHRRSRLFTVEGYITLESDYTEFFEQNTRENWVVVQLGDFTEVKKVYDSLVTEKSEGMYLKALAYSVESDSSFNEPRQNARHISSISGQLLVVKTILEMKKSAAYTNKERAAGLGYN